MDVDGEEVDQNEIKCECECLEARGSTNLITDGSALCLWCKEKRGLISTVTEDIFQKHVPSQCQDVEMYHQEDVDADVDKICRYCRQEINEIVFVHGAITLVSHMEAFHWGKRFLVDTICKQCRVENKERVVFLEDEVSREKHLSFYH